MNNQQGVHLYVIFTPLSKTDKTADLLRRTILVSGESVFVPKIERIKKIHSEIVPETRDLFPGYLFIETNDPDDLCDRLIDSAKFRTDYVRLLKNDNLVMPLLPGEEIWYRELEDENHVIGLSFGQIDEAGRLTVTSGPLKGKEDKIVHINRHKRIAVLKETFLGEEKTIMMGLETIRIK